MLSAHASSADLFGDPLKGKQTMFAPRLDQALENVAMPTPAEKDRIVDKLLDGELIASVNQAFASYVKARNLDPKAYWRKLTSPSNAEEMEFRNDMWVDLHWVVNRDPMFELCMLCQGGNVERYIDVVRDNFTLELALLERGETKGIPGMVQHGLLGVH
jgi:hypothetical protein